MMFSPDAPKIWPETLEAAGATMATEKRAGWSARTFSAITARRAAAASSLIGTDWVIRVQATGARQLARTLLRAPSMAMMRERPAMPILAAPKLAWPMLPNSPEVEV